MKPRKVIRWVLIGAAVSCVLLCGFVGFWFAASVGSSSGSPALAAEWRDHLAQYPDPKSASAADPEVIVLRCRNGEWAFGLSKNSHGIWYRGGGTVVVRDNTGQTRAFFGHVCGGGHLGLGPVEPSSLAEFYTRLVESGFREHPLQ
jgi:hypothetical protein